MPERPGQKLASDNRLGIGLIGQRFMGRAHSNAWSQASKFFELPCHPTLEVVAAQDRNSLAAFADRWGWRRRTTDWRELVADPAVDLVDIGAPNHLHHEPAIAALQAGKAVASEKPLAATLEAALAMRDAAREAQRPTFVWFNYRRCPAIGLAWMLMREESLGRILQVRATYLQDWGGASTPSSWRFRSAESGSGAHGDLNAHAVDLARFLLHDEIVEIHGAIGATFVSHRSDPSTGAAVTSDVDDALLFTASFEGGTVASFEASRVAGGNQNALRLEINGELGSLRWDLEEMNLLHYFDSRDGRKTGGWRRIMATSSGNHPYADAYWPDAHLLGYEHTFVSMAADICRSLRGVPPVLPLPDFLDAYQTQRALEAALISAREKVAVPLSRITA